MDPGRPDTNFRTKYTRPQRVNCFAQECKKDGVFVLTGSWDPAHSRLTLRVLVSINPGELVTFIVPAAIGIRLPHLGVTQDDPSFKISASAGDRSIEPAPVKKTQGINALIKTALSFNPPRANTTATIIFRFQALQKLIVQNVVQLVPVLKLAVVEK